MAREIETKCIHLEEKEDSIHHYGAMTYPIYQTATYAHPGVGQSTESNKRTFRENSRFFRKWNRCISIFIWNGSDHTDDGII